MTTHEARTATGHMGGSASPMRVVQWSVTFWVRCSRMLRSSSAGPLSLRSTLSTSMCSPRCTSMPLSSCRGDAVQAVLTSSSSWALDTGTGGPAHSQILGGQPDPNLIPPLLYPGPMHLDSTLILRIPGTNPDPTLIPCIQTPRYAPMHMHTSCTASRRTKRSSKRCQALRGACCWLMCSIASSLRYAGSHG